MRSERVNFQGASGAPLAGRLDLPSGPPVGWALFAHCFTCGKDLAASRRVAAALVQAGWGVLRFDFTGIGDSGGDFGTATFAANVDDLVLAAAWMREMVGAPALLVGHSLGGAAVIAAAPRIPEVRAVATIGAPGDPGHALQLFGDRLAEIETVGHATVELAGRPFKIGRELLEDLRTQALERVLNAGGIALLVLHSDQDAIVPVDHAARLFKAARHPKSFLSLDRADHLLSRAEDARWAGRVIAAWAQRYAAAGEAEAADPAVVEATIGDETLTTALIAGGHRLVADEPEARGGEDLGPSPHKLVLSGLGACTAMTMRMYAERKGWPLEQVRVTLQAGGPPEGGAAGWYVTRVIEMEGPLDDVQRARLLEVANRCPVHRTLTGDVFVTTTVATSDDAA